MDQLRRIHIRGFKSIREMELDLRRMNILIGANGAGKSNFLSAFQLLNRMAESEFRTFVAQAGGANALLHLGRKSTSELSIRLIFDQYGYEVILIPTAEDALVFRDERISGDDFAFRRPLEGLDAGISTETQLHLQVHRYGGETPKRLLADMKSWLIYHFHETSESAGIRLTTSIHDNVRLRHNGANLAAFLFLLMEKYPDAYRRVVRTIQLAIPFFEDFDLRPDPRQPESIRLEWRQKGSDEYFNASSLSDGALRFMCLTTLLMQPEPPSIILIDEPELGLHPHALTLLASMMKSVSVKTKVIASTQSVPLVNHFSPEDIIVVDRENSQSVFQRLTREEYEDWLEDYSVGELWEKNVIGGTPA